MVGPAHHGIKLPSLHVSLFGEGVKACERVRIFLSVPQWRSCPEEMLSHARALPFPPTFQRRYLLHIYPYAPVERSPTPLSSVLQPRGRSMEQLS
jgi:hypothetical protein